ncbi:MAG: hypothetical protein AAGF07_04310 [Patescibacteria group bacterium]
MVISLQNLEKALSELSETSIALDINSDLREYIKDSIDLGETLAILNLEIDLSKFKNVYTAAEFLNVVNQENE